MSAAKEKNREKLQEIADVIGDGALTEMFWDMFDDLSIKNQKHYLERAERIMKEATK
ncbi:hypothetical protein [Fictibacillus sp. NRS-1165]|uniref:hypothetical protein n=1 Tax=Fictibacillus sp. NRS-1165 TaxID=3144463 RepID=UPI003D1BACE6